jgi:Uncharacterized protein conserved in bacteria (DUF2325)
MPLKFIAEEIDANLLTPMLKEIMDPARLQIHAQSLLKENPQLASDNPSDEDVVMFGLLQGGEAAEAIVESLSSDLESVLRDLSLVPVDDLARDLSIYEMLERREFPHVLVGLILDQRSEARFLGKRLLDDYSQMKASMKTGDEESPPVVQSIEAEEPVGMVPIPESSLSDMVEATESLAVDDADWMDYDPVGEETLSTDDVQKILADQQTLLQAEDQGRAGQSTDPAVQQPESTVKDVSSEVANSREEINLLERPHPSETVDFEKDACAPVELEPPDVILEKIREIESRLQETQVGEAEMEKAIEDTPKDVHIIDASEAGERLVEREADAQMVETIQNLKSENDELLERIALLERNMQTLSQTAENLQSAPALLSEEAAHVEETAFEVCPDPDDLDDFDDDDIDELLEDPEPVLVQDEPVEMEELTTVEEVDIEPLEAEPELQSEEELSPIPVPEPISTEPPEPEMESAPAEEEEVLVSDVSEQLPDDEEVDGPEAEEAELEALSAAVSAPQGMRFLSGEHILILGGDGAQRHKYEKMVMSLGAKPHYHSRIKTQNEFKMKQIVSQADCIIVLGNTIMDPNVKRLLLVADAMGTKHFRYHSTSVQGVRNFLESLAGEGVI